VGTDPPATVRVRRDRRASAGSSAGSRHVVRRGPGPRARGEARARASRGGRLPPSFREPHARRGRVRCPAARLARGRPHRTGIGDRSAGGRLRRPPVAAASSSMGRDLGSRTNPRCSSPCSLRTRIRGRYRSAHGSSSASAERNPSRLSPWRRPDPTSTSVWLERVSSRNR
jgi:hypothetical protein